MANSSSGDISDTKFLTVAEVAAMMRVSKMTVYRLVHNGELPAVRVGKSFRVPEQAVNDYLRSAYFDAGCPRSIFAGRSRWPGVPGGRVTWTLVVPGSFEHVRDLPVEWS